MRSKKVMYNITAKFVYQIVAMICGLITPRLILTTFGSAYNGTISSIAQFLGVVSFLTAGIAGAMKPELYKTLATNDVKGTSVVVKTTEKEFQKIGIVLSGYTVVLSVVYPYIVRGEIPARDATFLVFCLALSTFGQYFFGQTYSLLLEADQCEYIATIVRTSVTALNTCLVYLLIQLKAGILLVEFGSNFLYFLIPVLIRIISRKKYKLIKEVPADSSVLKQRKAAMFHSIANIVHDKTDITLLTVFTNVKIISVYTVHYYVIANLKQVMQNFTTGLEGGFGSMWAKNEKELFRKHFSTYEFLMYAFTTCIFSCVGLLLVPFISLYTSGVEDVNYIVPSFAILVTVAEGIFCIRQPYVTIVQAAGKYDETKKYAIIEASVNLISSLILVNLIGLNGVIVGTLIANTMRTTQYAVFASKKLLNRKVIDFINRNIWLCANVAFIVLICTPIVKSINPGSWGKWIICGMISFMISLLVTVISSCLVYRNDLINSMNFVKRVRGK